MPRPVTIGDLRRESKLIEVGCTVSWHVGYIDPRSLPFKDGAAVPALYQRMRCPNCELMSNGF